MPGYSGTPLWKKLGVRPGDALCAVGAPAEYPSLVAPLPDGATIESRVDGSTAVVHHFATERAGLDVALRSYRALLAPDATVWVSWPKKASRVRTDITEDTIRELALPLGFVDVKVCAVTDVWSGLKLVVRKELR